MSRHMAATPEASVIICAHNPRENYFRRVMEALRHQSLSMAKWEFLLVDNASDVSLSSVWDISWHPNARHIREEELGVAIARRRGMREASADLLIFVDDDNVLTRSYLSDAVTIKGEWPFLGVWGSGAIIPEFETQPRKDVTELLPCLALRTSSSPQWSNVFTCIAATPWGAGMCVRAGVADAYCQFCQNSSIQIASRLGKEILMSGEDREICYAACMLGCGMGVFPQLRLTHLIPKERVTTEYLLKVYEGTSTSNLLLAYKHTGDIPQSPLRPRGLLSALKALLTRRALHRGMYLAQIRAALRARRIITESLGHSELRVSAAVSKYTALH
jgi:glycosyltransferase involved in cell wall biosynthesis